MRTLVARRENYRKLARDQSRCGSRDTKTVPQFIPGFVIGTLSTDTRGPGYLYSFHAI